MNTKKTSYKTIAISIILVVLAAVAYFYYNGKPSSSSSVLSSQDAEGEGDASMRMMSLFNQIKSLHIDTSLFKDSGYQTLRDYSTPIPTESVGRSNPFAPIPGTLEAAAQSAKPAKK